MLKADYDVCVATNGEKAIEVAKNRLPDLILLDNMMPGMTGVEACQAIKSDPLLEAIPVIFVTSMDDRHNEVVGLKAGAVDYIPKPPSAEIVRARVSVHLNNSLRRQFLERLADGQITDITDIQQLARRLL